MKYIIRNCPNYDNRIWQEPTCNINTADCQSVSDCLLKRIADKCDSNISKVLYEGETLKFIEGNKLASEILQLLNIEECE